MSASTMTYYLFIMTTASGLDISSSRKTKQAERIEFDKDQIVIARRLGRMFPSLQLVQFSWRYNGDHNHTQSNIKKKMIWTTMVIDLDFRSIQSHTEAAKKKKKKFKSSECNHIKPSCKSQYYIWMTYPGIHENIKQV